MPSSFATLAIGRDVSITIFTASSLNSGEKLFFGRGKTSPFQIVHLIGWTVRKARGTSLVLRSRWQWTLPGMDGQSWRADCAAWLSTAETVSADSGAGCP